MMRQKIGIFFLIAALLFLAAPQGEVQAASGTTIFVNAQQDELNNNGNCTLREAIQAANTNSPVDACPAGSSSGTDLILLPPGDYRLTRTGTKEDNNQSGDLDITGSLILRGFGPSYSIISGRGIDRVLHLHNVSMRIERLTIRGGQAPVEQNGISQGGGIYSFQSALAISDSVISGNSSTTFGGGIDNNGGNLTLLRTILRENSSTFGGGVFNGSTLTILNSTIENNQANHSGGGVYNNNDLDVFTSLFFGNRATLNGGGLNNSYYASLNNVSFSENSAGDDQEVGGGLGGGIFNDGSIDADYTTIADNRGDGFKNSGEARLSNTLLARNSGVNCSGEEPFISSGYNLEDADSCNFNQATDLPNITDPKLDVLADNGGQTLTYALLPGSPAIDRADSGQCTATDQRGAPRPVNGDGVAPTGCDIGAFELGGPPEAAVSADSSFYFLPATLNH